MSLVTYPNSDKPNASGSASKKNANRTGSAPTVAGRLRKVCAAAGRLCVNVFDAIAEAERRKR